HIEQRERFLLTSHARPDGDAVGSALACCQILRSMGKEADVVLRDGVPRVYRPLPFADRVVQSDRVNGEYEAAIILECDSIQRTHEHTFGLARELVLAGADPVRCARNIYFGHSTAKMRLLGAALSNLHREGPLALISVTQEQMELCGAREEDCEGLVNYALAI